MVSQAKASTLWPQTLQNAAPFNHSGQQSCGQQRTLLEHQLEAAREETREGGAVEHTPLGDDPALSSDVDDLASDGETRSGRRHCRTQHHSGQQSGQQRTLLEHQLEAAREETREGGAVEHTPLVS